MFGRGCASLRRRQGRAVGAGSDTQFESGGWSIIRGFLHPSELEPIRTGVNDALLAPRPSCMNRPGNDLVPLRWSDAVVAHILGSTQRVQRLRRLLGADDLKWLSGYLSIKAPHSPALWWHQDWWCWDHPVSFARPAPQVAVLCYLTDTNEGNGALRILPGSHHQSTPLHGQLPEPHGEAANRISLDHTAMRDHPDQITVAVRTGDAVVLDYRLLHGTHANDTARRRDCILFSFMPNWAALPPEIKAHCAMHPALPNRKEASSVLMRGYADLLPRFAGPPASLVVNRVAPANFRTQ